MREFDYSLYKEQKWDSETLSLIGGIYKEAGKGELFLLQRSQDLDKLIEISKVQSVQSSNEIEGIVSTSSRIRLLVEEKTSPRNRAEQEIAGYRDAMKLIHESYEAIPLSPNYILQLHKILYGHMNNPFSGKTKTVQNYIVTSYKDGHHETLFTPLSPYETPIALEKISQEYSRIIGNNELDPLLIIPIYIRDFLSIHPFNDGNGRMSRLLTNLLLLQNGFNVAKYISLEEKISKSKDQYYDSLFLSQRMWHEGKDDPLPFIKYLLGVILSSYKDLTERISLLSEKLPAIELVRKATLQKVGTFTKREIMSLCPSLSLSSVEASLRKMVNDGELKRVGSTRNIKYFRNA